LRWGWDAVSADASTGPLLVEPYASLVGGGDGEGEVWEWDPAGQTLILSSY
jgi:hypothetical protein